MNWSRFRNMRRIVSLLCGPELEPIKKHPWNNNSKPLTYLVDQNPLPCNGRFFFQSCFKRLYSDSCTEEKLKYIDSMEDMYLHCNESFVRVHESIHTENMIQPLGSSISMTNKWKRVTGTLKSGSHSPLLASRLPVLPHSHVL